MIDCPLSSGVAPPTIPLLPPWGTRQILFAAAILTMPETCSVELGEIIALAAPVYRPRQSVSQGRHIVRRLRDAFRPDNVGHLKKPVCCFRHHITPEGPCLLAIQLDSRFATATLTIKPLAKNRQKMP